MNAVKLVFVAGILAISIVLCLWALGLIGQEQAASTTLRSLAVVVILGVSIVGIYAILGNKKSTDHGDDKPNSGPKF